MEKNFYKLILRVEELIMNNIRNNIYINLKYKIMGKL